MSTRGESEPAADGRPAGEPAAEPAAGEQYNPGPATTPRQAASVILLRGGEQLLEVLLVRRTPKARFMGGVWVFPGGAVDRGEGAGEQAHRAAAVRELQEEAAIELADADALISFSRWITPAQVKIRYDTHFFLAPLPSGQDPRVDGEEVVDLGWFEPRAALAAHSEGKIALVFPTIKHLEQLSTFGSVHELLSYARGRDVQPVEPKVLLEGEVARVLLPGDAGY
jgi:8-oxo-dGTP pyrophosphatase MutT (NUDIX family)